MTNRAQTEADKEKQEAVVKSGAIPEHVAVIMDGNGRWAKEQGSLRVLGHKAGVESVRDITEACAQLGVKHLTLYAFSTENWGRPGSEINALIQLLISTLRSEVQKLHKNNIRLTTIGQIDRFPEVCRRELRKAVDLTKENDRMELCLALSYSGRWDITEAVKRIVQEIEGGKIRPEDIDEQLVSDHLATANVPDPDLIIRTSGEFRLSNFLLWQLAYSEVYISSTLWPDFRRDELYEAILSYQVRDRRYGKVGYRSNKNLVNSVINHITS